MFDTTTEQYGTSFIEEKIPFVQKIAGRVHRKLPPSVLKDDLVSAGIIGLLDAANKFDASSGVQFEKYAGFRIRGAMIDELRKMDCVPRAVRAKINRTRKFCELFEKMNGRTPEIDEVTSLNEAFVYDRDIDLEDCPSQEEDSFEILSREETKRDLAKMLKELSQSEKTVISLMYYNQRSMTEVGEEMGLTVSRISQIHKGVLSKLRKKSRSLSEYPV
jgi:RNA polymerase sigma factor FliA